MFTPAREFKTHFPLLARLVGSVLAGLPTRSTWRFFPILTPRAVASHPRRSDLHGSTVLALCVAHFWQSA